MIEVTKLNGNVVIVNGEQIHLVESTPDTMIIFQDGKSMVVKDSPVEIQKKFIEFKRSIVSTDNQSLELDLG